MGKFLFNLVGGSFLIVGAVAVWAYLLHENVFWIWW